MEVWKESILNSLVERDRREKAQVDIISAYTRLASRTASLEAKLLTSQSPPTSNLAHLTLQDPSGSSLPRANPLSTDRTTPSRTTSQTHLPLAPTNSGTLDPSSAPPSAHIFTQLKADLLEAQRTKATLTQNLTTLQTSHNQLVQKHSSCSAQITKLTAERDLARKKLDTREEEMRFKNKQVERLQDEIMAYEMQLNVLHQQKDSLQAEYDGLVKRMMKYKEREAEELINNSKYS